MRSIGYLSAAPRVTTRPDAELTGARAHVVGVINAFEALGWHVERFIVGDRMSGQFSGAGSESSVSGNYWRTLVIDCARIGMGVVNAMRARRTIGDGVVLVYERLAVLQSLGWIFRRRGIPWILETNAILYREAKVDRNSIVLVSVAKFMEHFAYRHCDLIVCVTDTLKQMLLADLDIAPEKIIVMPNAVDTTIFDPAIHAAKRAFDSFTIGFVGALYQWQALDLLIDAVNELQAEGLDLAVVIVGDGQMRAAWEAQVKQLHLEQRIRFTGRVHWSEVPSYLAGVDVCYSGQAMTAGSVYLSPLKLYEYMAMAKPVIAADFEETRRLSQDGDLAFLFQSGDRDSLKAALRRAYDMRADLNAIGLRGREAIVEHHNWENRVSYLLDYAKTRGLIADDVESSGMNEASVSASS